VHVYLLSQGIDTSQPDFSGRATNGPSFVTDQPGAEGCNTVGTEVAGVVGGTQVGVAKKVSIVAVRVFGCVSASDSSIVDGFNWVIEHAIRPAVVQFDIDDDCIDPKTHEHVSCDPATASTMVELQNNAFGHGIAVVTGAGNKGADACHRSSGTALNTIYVGATTMNDARAGFSDFGPCLTMWAPGEAVATDSPNGPVTADASYLAAAYVTGAVALFMSKPEFANASPAEIREQLVTRRSTPDVLTDLGSGSPNRLLFTGPGGVFTVGSSIGLVQRSGGSLEVYGATSAGYLMTTRQITPGGTAWSSPAQSKTKGWLSLAVEPNADGRIELAGLTPAGDIWPREQADASAATWLNWSLLDRPSSSTALARVALARNLNDRLEIVATDQQGHAYYRAQTAPGSRALTSWTPFAFTGKLRSITAAANTDGRIEVLGVDDAGQVWHSAQLAANGDTWSEFTKLDGFAMAMIAVSRNSNGTLELVGIDTGGGAWRRSQTSPGGTSWSAWTALSSKTLADIAAETNADGRIQLVAVDNLGNIWQSAQSAANSATYSAWSTIAGNLRP
jgi:hypothetical protein